MKKSVAVIITTVLLISALTGCSLAGNNYNTNTAISVVSREEGSGTRGAFIELFGIEVRSDDGTRKDTTTKEAIIADKTDIVMTNIANDPFAIGYISLGSLNDTIKAIDIDGVKATVENVKNKTYLAQRPFNIAVKGEAEGLAKDFIDFILSKEGQDLVAANNYIAINEEAADYAGSNLSGKIVVAGSSSVTPIMEKLREAYLDINPGAVIEIQMNDSSAGIKAAQDGTCDIGMASRALRESELAELTEITIALDGIAVIVNKQNPLENLTGEQVRSIFTGEVERWNAVQ